MLDCIYKNTVYVNIVKISLGKNKLSICRNNFLSFLCFTLTENVMNCFAHNLSLPSKPCMMFFCEQIELQVINLFNHHILFQEYAPFKFVCIHWTFRFHFPPAWALNFDLRYYRSLLHNGSATSSATFFGYTVSLKLKLVSAIF